MTVDISEYGRVMQGVHTGRGFWLHGEGRKNYICAYCKAGPGQPCVSYPVECKESGFPPPYPDPEGGE